MRVTTWNIRSGGGGRVLGIAGRLLEEAPDVCVLTEYRTRPGERLKAALGIGETLETSPPPNQNGVMCYASCPLEAWDCPAEIVPASRHRWLTAWLPEHDIHILGIHIPNEKERWNKTEFWTQVGAFALCHLSSRALIIGDFNTGIDDDMPGYRCIHDEQFRALAGLGFVDAWRAVHGDRREFTWYSPNAGNGFRLDHCFLSPALAPELVGASYNHAVREERLSDHSMLTVEIRG